MIQIIKDLYNTDGSFLKRYLLENILNKINWMVEYRTVRNIVTKLAKRSNTNQAIWVNVFEEKNVMVYCNNIYKLADVNSKLLYNILIRHTFSRPSMEYVWAR